MTFQIFALNKLDFDKIREILRVYLSTPTGERRIRELNPSGDTGMVLRRLDHAAEMMQLLISSESPPLETLYDISEALSKSRIERFVLDGQTLSQVGRWAESTRKMRTFFSRHSETCGNLWEIARSLVPVKELEQHIRRIIDEKGEFRSDASPELARINQRILTQKQAARSVLQRILRQGKESGMTGDDEATLRGGRLVIPVKTEYKRKIQGFIHDTSATGQTVYIEPVEVFEKNNEIRELAAAWKREADRLLRELTQQVGKHADILTQNSLTIGQIDACYAAARLGMRWNGVIPEISDDGSLLLKECRNPLLLLKYEKLSNALEYVVPLDLDMESDEKGIVITGPNAGGKSVALKTFGLNVVLAQCGIPIPAQEGAIIPCIAGLHIDMGDEQSIDNDLSTFSSRLTWMKQVLLHAEPQSWILIDEAGSGTDPDEGTALVQAFLEILSEKGIRSIVTTHHGALKIFAHETAGWTNASMEFDQKTLSPTYRFQKGIPGSSYAFEIADRLDVPSELTRRARQWVGASKNKLESLIVSLEQQSQQLQNQKDEIEQQERSWKKSKEELDKRLERVNEERDEIRNRAIKEAEELLQNANRRIEDAIRAASEQDKEKLREKRKEVEQLGVKVQKKHKKQQRRKAATQKKAPEIGDPVRLMDSNSTGELVEVSGKKATVNVNGLRVKTQFDNLERSDRAPSPKKATGYKLTGFGIGSDEIRPFSGSLDIRGKRGEDAVQEVTRYVDEGLSRGMEQLAIIHGKGNGILRKLVHNHLAARPDVRHFETAPIEEGGDGCTYVYL